MLRPYDEDSVFGASSRAFDMGLTFLLLNVCILFDSVDLLDPLERTRDSPFSDCTSSSFIEEYRLWLFLLFVFL